MGTFVVLWIIWIELFLVCKHGVQKVILNPYNVILSHAKNLGTQSKAMGLNTLKSNNYEKSSLASLVMLRPFARLRVATWVVGFAYEESVKLTILFDRKESTASAPTFGTKTSFHRNHKILPQARNL